MNTNPRTLLRLTLCAAAIFALAAAAAAPRKSERTERHERIEKAERTRATENHERHAPQHAAKPQPARSALYGEPRIPAVERPAGPIKPIKPAKSEKPAKPEKPAGTAGRVKIAFLCDLHVSPRSANEEQLSRAVREINAGDCGLVIVAGDLTNEGSDEELRGVKSILDSLRKPVHCIPGNHENNWSESACRTFRELWGDTRFAAEAGGLVVAGLDCGPYMKMGDGHVKREDLAWLDSTLARYGGRRIISVNHYPLNEDIDDLADYARILAKYRAAVHLCGHYHRIARYETAGIDCLVNRALDMGGGDYGYTVIEIDGDTLRQWNKRIGMEPLLANEFAVDDGPKGTVTEEPCDASSPDGFTIECLHRDEASIFTRLGVDRRRIYLGNSLGRAKALRKRDGKQLWSVAGGDALYSRPVPAGRRVIIPTADGRLLWVGRRDGRVRREAVSRGPFVADGVLYQGGSRTFGAWDAATARPLWHFDDIGGYCQAAPAVTDKEIVFGAWDTFLRSLDPADGTLRWSWSNGSPQRLFSPGNCSPVTAGDKVFIVAPDRFMTALDRRTGREIWRVNDRRVRESMGISADGKRVYARTMDGELIAVDAEADEYRLLWAADLTFGYEHTPCVVAESDGVAYAASRRGYVAAVNAESGRLLWVRRLGRSAVNGFETDADGSVYLSMVEGSVWRISRKPHAERPHRPRGSRR